MRCASRWQKNRRDFFKIAKESELSVNKREVGGTSGKKTNTTHAKSF
jgi:hypothetical protein